MIVFFPEFNLLSLLNLSHELLYVAKVSPTLKKTKHLCSNFPPLDSPLCSQCSLTLVYTLSFHVFSHSFLNLFQSWIQVLFSPWTIISILIHLASITTYMPMIITKCTILVNTLPLNCTSIYIKLPSLNI